jgi:hypothetical protein
MMATPPAESADPQAEQSEREITGKRIAAILRRRNIGIALWGVIGVAIASFILAAWVTGEAFLWILLLLPFLVLTAIAWYSPFLGGLLILAAGALSCCAYCFLLLMFDAEGLEVGPWGFVPLALPGLAFAAGIALLATATYLKSVRQFQQPVWQRFWDQFQERARLGAPGDAPIAPVDNRLRLPAPQAGFFYDHVIAVNHARVELTIDWQTIPENRRIFYALRARREQLEQDFGADLQWPRLALRQAGRIRHRISTGGLGDEDRWPEIQEGMLEAMRRLEKVLAPVIEQL